MPGKIISTGICKKTKERKETPIVLADFIHPVLADLCEHTAATTLALENIPPSIIQKIMRHAKFSTLEKYIHINIEPMREAINMLQKKKTEGTPQAGEYPP